MTDDARFGISGLSTVKNIQTASAANGCVGIAGPNTRQIIYAGEQATVGIAGLDTSGANAVGSMGIAGNLGGGTRTRIESSLPDVAALRGRDQTLAGITPNSERLGDRAARKAWARGVWFADFTYICTPYAATENGGYAHDGRMGWRSGREQAFGRPYRSLPLLIDSCGYRRELTGTAPQWAMEFETYPQAIELLDPDGYAAWDYPTDRARSLKALHELMQIFPGDERLWPVFSIRWTWSDRAHLSFARLPGWSSRNLSSLIPQTRTQRQFADSTRELWARQAIANALVLAADPDFRWMAKTFGKVMIGGMVGCACNRSARHLFAAVLAELFPDVRLWLLGQANFATVNGLGMMGLLDRVSTDGTWWIKDATCERFAFVEDGLITMHSFETKARQRGERRQKRRETFFTMTEMMAANLRSLLSAYQGLWSWPPPEPLPVDLLDIAQAVELKQRYHAAQLELGL